jgi:hypothetical protein
MGPLQRLFSGLFLAAIRAAFTVGLVSCLVASMPVHRQCSLCEMYVHQSFDCGGLRVTPVSE